MSKEIAKKLIAELQTNEELKAKIASITDPVEMVKEAVEAGYDVTIEEMLEAEHEYREEIAAKSDVQSVELTTDELEAAAGGQCWRAEYSKDGKEFGCAICNLNEEDQKKSGEYCKFEYFCAATNVGGTNHTHCLGNAADEKHSIHDNYTNM